MPTNYNDENYDYPIVEDTTWLNEMGEHIRTLPHLHEEEYKKGFNAFLYGDKVPVSPTPYQRKLLAKRRKMMQAGNKQQVAILTNTLYMFGIRLVEVDANTTETFYSIQATNPYPKDTLIAKEWERGFNAAYTINRQRVKRRERNNLIEKSKATGS